MGALHRSSPQWTTVFFVVCLFVLTLSYSGAGFNLHLLSLWGLILLGWLALSIARLDLSRSHLASGWLPLVVLMYLGWLLIAPSLSSYPYGSFTKAMSLAVLPLVFLGRLAEPANSATTVKWIKSSLVLCAVAMAIWGMVDFLVSRERAHAAFLDANAYAALINLFLIPVVYLYLGAPSTENGTSYPKLLLTLATVLALAQGMSLSRGALIAFLATLSLLLWLRRKSPVFWARLPWLLGILVTTHVLVNFTAPIPPRGIDSLLLAPEQAIQDSSIRERLLILKSTWQMIKDSNPVIGSGLGTFKILYPAYRDPDESSGGNFVHNDYLQAFQEGGVVQLTFLLVLTVYAPLWLLLMHVTKSGNFGSSCNDKEIGPGLLLGIGCASLHALVNFIHYVGPLTFLVGLYLAHCWETFQPRHEIRIGFVNGAHVKPGIVKTLLVLVLAAPVVVLAADGVIFKLFATDRALHMNMVPDERVAALNLALAVRPGNPMPRIMLIRALVAAAEKSDSNEAREELLSQAEQESAILSNQAPGLALAQHYFPAKILVLRESSSNLIGARYHLEKAVQLVPPSTTMRLELVRTYTKLGQITEAHQTVAEAKKWVRFEIDLDALTAFAEEAEKLVAGDREEAYYWNHIQSEISRIKSARKLTTLANPVE